VVARELGDPPLASETLFPVRRRSAAPLELHRVRPAGGAACLRRRHPTNRSAFHRIDLHLAAQASSIGLVVQDSRRSHPTPCRLSRAAPAPSRAWLVAPRYPRLRRSRLAARPTTSRKDVSHRLLQPTSCHEHPYGSFDSRARLPLTLSGSLRDDSRPRLFRRRPDPGGASLDGDPPASVTASTLQTARSWRLRPLLRYVRWRRPVLAGLRSTAPPNGASRPRSCRPRAELVTPPLTLPVASSLSRAFARCPLDARLDFAGASSKPPVSSNQSAFHRRMLPCGSPPPFSRLRRREAASEAGSPLARRSVSRSLPRG